MSISGTVQTLQQCKYAGGGVICPSLPVYITQIPLPARGLIQVDTVYFSQGNCL